MEDDRVDGERQLERRREVLGRRAHVEGAREGQLGGREHGRQPDGDNGENETWSFEEAPDDEQLDDAAQHNRRRHTAEHGQRIGPSPGDDQQHGERRRYAPQVALREVDDAVGPVDQGDAEGHQRGEAADDDAPHQHAQRRRPEPLLDQVKEQHNGGDVAGAPHPRIVDPSVEWPGARRLMLPGRYPPDDRGAIPQRTSCHHPRGAE